MADWKYIMVNVDGTKMPIIFPGNLIHQDVWASLRKMFGELPIRENGVVAVEAAGFVAGLTAVATVGESETLKLRSDQGDAAVINTWPYLNGRDDGLPLEHINKYIKVKAAEMLLDSLGEG